MLNLTEVLALSFFVPIVMAMCGSTGMQSSTLIIRSLALNTLEGASIPKLLGKEIGDSKHPDFDDVQHHQGNDKQNDTSTMMPPGHWQLVAKKPQPLVVNNYTNNDGDDRRQDCYPIGQR